MAQVEMFFTHGIHLAPLTIAVMGRLSGGSLVPTFYAVVDRMGGISRREVEAEPGSPWPAWHALRPRLEGWLTLQPNLEEWQRELVRGAMAYEEHRLRFVNSQGVDRGGMASSGEDWGAFASPVDVAALFDRLRADDVLTPDLVRDCLVVFVHERSRAFGAYTTGVERLPELRGRQSLMEPSAA
jgi:hypothetical protein